MTREEAIRMGDMAAHLLDNELVQLIFKRMETDYIDAWLDTTRADHDGREQLYYAIKTLEIFRSHLKVIADNGKFDRVQLERARDKAGFFDLRNSE
jgi:hypothetical protein